MKEYTILVVDDEANQRDALSGFLRKRGYGILTAVDGAEALEAVRREQVDLVISDLRMPGLDGLSLLREIRQLQPEVGFILTTAFGTVENAVEVMKLGATHYLSKPVDLEKLLLTIAQLQEKQLLQRENRLLREKLREQRPRVEDFISGSGEMEEVLNLAFRAAPSRATILILGESGSGKERVARLIHNASLNSAGEFVPVNVAAVPETLIESELFGHEKGAFTGAEKRKIGLMERAQGGTLFIDEVGDIPLMVQVKLLRSLQENRITRVGGTESIELNVRFIAATHRNLAQLVKEGKFREDLYYRLNVISLQLPPLRRRKADIPPLVEHFIQRYAVLNGKEEITISREAMDTLLKYDYPGNVRELENAVERAVVLCRDQVIRRRDLPLPMLSPREEDGSHLEEGTLPQILERLEKRLVKKALEKTGGNKSKAARLLGISEKNIRDRLKRWNQTGEKSASPAEKK
jgi:two-component system NtrC family response regulator